jgi:hypothetical protein
MRNALALAEANQAHASMAIVNCRDDPIRIFGLHVVGLTSPFMMAR